jgi:hypothetical protein
MNNLDDIIKQFATDFLNTFLFHLQQPYITASGRKFQGLKKANSNLLNSATVVVDSTPTIKLEVEDYFKYFDAGRKPFSRKIPVSIILRWIKNKRIRPRDTKGRFKRMSINDLAYAIQQSIFNIGIRPRNIIQKTLRDIDKLYRDNLEPEIGLLIDNLFEQFNLTTVRDSKVTFNIKPKRIK